MPGTHDLRDLVEVSRFAGRDLLLVQGAGGNTSVKTDGGSRLLIKASGFRLDDVSESGGHLELDLHGLRAIFEEPGLSALSPGAAHDETVRLLQTLISDAGAPRPSMETGFHLLLERVVLHTHPVYVNAFTCSEEGRAALDEAFDEPVAWIPYATPGYPLATVVAAGCAEYTAERGHPPRRIVLENHGLITTARSAAAAIDDTRSLVRCGERYFGALPDSACDTGAPSRPAALWAERLGRIFAEVGHAAVVRPACRNALLSAVRLPEPLTEGPLVPDDAVYGVHSCWHLDPAVSPEEWVDARREELPAKAVLVLRGEGVLLVGPNARSLDFLEENLLANALLHRLIGARGKARYLESAAVGELLALESEQYRQALARREPPGATGCRS